MKKLVVILLLSLVCLAVNGQVDKKIHANLAQRMQIPANPDQYVTVLVRGDVEIIQNLTALYGGYFRFAEGDIASLTIQLKYLTKLAENSAIKELELAHAKNKPLNDKMILGDHTNAVAVEDGSCFNGTAYNGEGVVIGIIDTGIDITHPDFKDSTGHYTRIRYLWDQRQSGNAPAPFNYGTEWHDYDIDAGFCTSNDSYNNSHGTIVAGIAAGNGNCSGSYHGVAPQADLIIVALDFLNPNFTIADAAKYIYDRAALLGKPCVINASVGDYFGAHDGLDLEGQLIGNLISNSPGRSLVCAAGNAGGDTIHLKYNVTSDTSFTWFNYTACAGCDTFIYMEIWGDTSTFRNIQFAIGADSINLPSNYFVYEGHAPFRSINQFNSGTYDTLKNIAGYPIAKVRYNVGVQNGNSDYLQVMITPMNAHVTDGSHFYRLMTTGIGKFDCWSFDMQYRNLPTAIIYPSMLYYKLPDNNQNIAGGFNSSDKVITVGGYANRNSFVSNIIDTITHQHILRYDSTIHPGELYNVSSHGPARDGRIKPEITSPGLWVMAPGVLSEMSSSNWKEGVGGCTLISSGTSMASPSVAGIVALYLQRRPNATWGEIKNCIINNARVDAWVTMTAAIPNNYWGYGKADACLAMKCLNTDVIERKMIQNVALSNYPNPFDGETTIAYTLPEDYAASQAMISINDVLGNVIRSIPLTNNQGTISFNKSQLQSGIYFYSLKVNGRTLSTRKMIVL